VVIDEPFQWTPEMRTLIDERVASVGLFTNQNVAKLTVISIATLEHVCFLLEKGHSIGHVLRSYHLDTGRDVALDNYIDEDFEGLNVPGIVGEGFNSFVELVVDALSSPT
jgi:hypothetical protein